MLGRNRAPQLDGQVTDAVPGVKHAGSNEGMRGASIEAGRAGSAMTCLMSRIGLQIQVEQEGAEEEVAAEPLVQQHGVLAEPAESRPSGEIAFQEGGCIDDATARAAGNLVLDPGEELVQARTQDVMVIGPLGIASDTPCVRPRRR